MKAKLTSLFFTLVAAVGLSSCVSTAYVGGYETCYLEYDYWYNEYYEVCQYYYSNSEGEVIGSSSDIVADAAQKEEKFLNASAEFYANEFNLSKDKGLQLAKTLKDFNATTSRTEEDLADFAQRLYGINPSEIVSAVSSAQSGDSADLNKVVEQAALKFETDTENMKEIVKFLHGKTLKDNGINL